MTVSAYPEALPNDPQIDSSKMSSAPLVSVIIPTYNHARFVGDAILSVLQQDYDNFEVIVVDDGSGDNTREVIKKFEGRVEYIYQKNAGLSAARNTGIRASKGVLIGVLDADDMYEPKYLSTLVGTLISHPDADGVYCGYRFVDEENNHLPQIENRQVPSGELYNSLINGNFFVPESILLHRYVYDKVGLFDEGLRACEDWDVWLRTARRFRIIGRSDILTRHRVLAGSMSTDPLRMLTARLHVLKKHVGDEPISGGSTLAHHSYGRAYLSSCIEYIQSDVADDAYNCFYRMADICPELLLELDTYYQLGCADQPKGGMGDLATLDVNRNEIRIRVMMRSLYADQRTSPSIKRIEKAAYAKANKSLGVLAYNTRVFKDVRRFFASAVRSDPLLLLDGQIIGLWLKSILNPILVEHLRRFRSGFGRR